jgi:hypothetical protein
MAAVRARSAASDHSHHRECRPAPSARAHRRLFKARPPRLDGGNERKAKDMIQKNWQELIKPNKVEFTSSGRTKATLVAEPLERGFGLTLGNALRRVLLSSLRGAAVTAVQIDGVLHEFSSIPGVREDVTDIVLNIKEIAIKMDGDDSKRMVVRKQGPGVVTAGDIQTVGDIEILNPTMSSAPSTRAPRSAWSSPSTTARAMSRPSATALKTLRSASSRSTASTRRSRRCPTRWKTPVKDRFSTTTS